MTPSTFRRSWLAARTAAGMRKLLAAPAVRVAPAGWEAFWAAYAPAAGADRRSAAVRLAADQTAAAEAALAAATAASPRVRAAVARTYTRAYWLDVYGAVERRLAAARQARYLITLAAPGWTPDPQWRTSTVVAIVAGMVADRDASAAPVLADALQDAGCDSSEWLELLRDPAQPWFPGSRLLDTLGC